MWNGRANLLYSTDRPTDRPIDRKKQGKKNEISPSMLSVRFWLPKCLANEDSGPYIAGAGTRHLPSTNPRTRSRVLNPRSSLSLSPSYRPAVPHTLMISHYCGPKGPTLPEILISIRPRTSTSLPFRFVCQFTSQSTMHCYQYDQAHCRHVFEIIAKLMLERDKFCFERY